MKLSKNLSLAEVTKSVTAKRLGIDNTPDEWTTENLKQIAVNVFQPLRDALKCPIHVSSGYRSADLNTAIGGSSRSQHIQGRALDLDADVYGGTTNADIFRYILNNLTFDQLIWEFGDEYNPNWVHVSYSTNPKFNKHEVLIAKRKGGRTVYEYWKD